MTGVAEVLVEASSEKEAIDKARSYPVKDIIWGPIDADFAEIVED